MIKGLETPQDSLQTHTDNYFPLRRGCRSVSAHLYGQARATEPIRVRFGSLADINPAIAHVRFTPDSGHPARPVMSALCQYAPSRRIISR